MINLENNTNKKIQLELHVEDSSKSYTSNTANTGINPQIFNKKEEIKDKSGDRVKWAFRVLFNNIIFLGIFAVGGAIHHNSDRHQGGIYNEGFASNNKTILDQKNSKVNIVNDVLFPDMTFVSLHNLEPSTINERIKNNDVEYFQKNKKNIALYNKDINGLTPLQLAVMYNRHDIVNILTEGNIVTDHYFNIKGTNYSLLMLPEDISSSHDFSFSSKRYLIERGLDVSQNNYEFVKKTLGNPLWLEFWKEHFTNIGKKEALISIMERQLTNKDSIINDINNIEKLQNIKTI